MAIGRREQEIHRQARAATEQGMDTIAMQQWARMMRGSMTRGSIGIGSAPSQDGSTIDNQIASSDQMTTHSTPDGEHKEGLKRRGSLPLASVCTVGKGWECAAGHLKRGASHRPEPGHYNRTFLEGACPKDLLK